MRSSLRWFCVSMSCLRFASVILTVLKDVAEHTSCRDALKYAIDKANDNVYATAMEMPELRGMGTTVAAMIISEKSAVIAHVGDSRIYHLRKGAIVYRSADHSQVAELVRMGQLSEEEARNAPNANIITRALGIRPEVEIEFDEQTFRRGDRFVLCTDGIWGAMPQSDLVKALSRVMGIEELTAKMCNEVDQIGINEGGRHDNLTLAVVDTTFDSARQKKTLFGLNSKMFLSAVCVSGLLGIAVVGGYFFVPEGELKQSEIATSLTEVEEIVGNENVRGDVEAPNRSDSIQDSIISRNPQKSNGEAEPKILKKERNINQEKVAVHSAEGSSISFEIVNPSDAKMIDPSAMHNGDKNFYQQEETNLTVYQLIYGIINDLEKLKNLQPERPNKKYKKQYEQKKVTFVNKTIVPKLQQLRNMYTDKEGKEHEVDVILELLKQPKSVSTSEKGQSTKEGNQHIDTIIKNLRNLGERRN